MLKQVQVIVLTIGVMRLHASQAWASRAGTAILRLPMHSLGNDDVSVGIYYTTYVQCTTFWSIWLTAMLRQVPVVVTTGFLPLVATRPAQMLQAGRFGTVERGTALLSPPMQSLGEAKKFVLFSI